jgi:hypothetical protein
MKKLFPTKPPLQAVKVPKRKPTKAPPGETKRKAKIPAAIQEAIWIQKMGRVFEGKCLTTWCPNIITVFDYHAGHDIPESKGGDISLENLFPICARCNLSMGDRYTFKEWCALSEGTFGSLSPEKPPQAPQPPQPPQPQLDLPPRKRKWWCF